jgi:hypothetical protein
MFLDFISYKINKNLIEHFRIHLNTFKQFFIYIIFGIK